MKKILTLIIAAVTALTCVFAGCGGSDNSNKEYSGRERKITLSYYYGGFGDAYWLALARDYMEHFDSEVYLEMNPYYDSNAMRSHIQAGTHGSDIVQISVDMFRRSSQLEELSEVYNSAPLLESTLIKDKSDWAYDYYLENYKVNGEVKKGLFQLPSGSLGGYHFAYNKSTLDEVFGKDNYQLPRTTDEFFKFGNDMFEEGAYLTSAAIADVGGGDYLEYLYQLWFAQLTGLEKYDRFYAGEYFDTESGEYKLADGDKPLILDGAESEIKDAYSVCDRLLRKENNFLHPASGDLDYLKNDKVFAGAGDGLDFEKTGFLFIGSWYENEIAPLLADGVIEEQEYGMMRVPVNSNIVKYLSYRDGTEYMSDATLSAIVKAIDDGETSFSGVSSEDFEKVKSARKMAINQICSEIVVPTIKDASKKADIIKILRYLATDRAQKITAEATGGLNMLAFGKRVNESDITVKQTRFVKEFNEIAKDVIPVDYAHINKIFPQIVTVKWYYIPGGGRLSSYCYTNSAPQSAAKMYESLYANLSGTWKNHVKTYLDSVVESK